MRVSALGVTLVQPWASIVTDNRRRPSSGSNVVDRGFAGTERDRAALLRTGRGNILITVLSSERWARRAR
jgi:hypothetical protein